ISLRSFVVQHPDCQFPALDAYLETQFLAIAPSMPISELLHQGKFLFLIDGLDEVGLEAMSPLCQTIQRWTQVYGLNRFIVTCRTAARQYLFQGFTYTELAEFNPEQIEQFVEKFFLSTSATHEDGEQKAQEFLEQLYRKPNQPIRDLVTTPILLNLVCSIFLARKTLPVNRAKLYQAGLDILMEQWDEARGINRDSTGSLLLSKVERLKLLSYLAAQTFEQGKFFFDKQDILPIIVEHRQRLQEQPSDDAEHLWARGEQIIRAIAAQNGLLVEKAKDIYCFSHLTFHEYLTARNIVAAPNPEALEQRLRELAAKVEHHHWQEIIFLTVNLLTEPLQFLAMLQANILAIAMPSAKVRRFLDMIDQKVQQLSLAYPQWSLRTFYFSSLINADRKLSFTAEPLIARQLASELALDLKLIGLLSAIEQVIEAPSMSNMLALYSALNFEAQHALDPEFLTSVQALRAELPRHLSESHTQQDWWKQRTQQNWWEQEGQDWLRRWKLAVKEHRGLSLDWQWSEDEAQILQTYYQANQLLVNCLQFEARLTVPEREAIMDQLLVVPSNEAASEITAQ
ncbi:MAG: NACHT domain-containing protein, partial [Cyanobacteria bacterium P01_F01_bin.42]